MFPEGFINRIQTQKYIEADALLKALKEPSPVSIRINPAKWNKKPLSSEPVPWCNNGYYLKSRPSYTLILFSILDVIILRRPQVCFWNR